MPTDNLPEVETHRPIFPFDTEKILIELESDPEHKPPGYADIARQILKDPTDTSHRSRRENDHKQLDTNPPYLRHKSIPLIHDRWDDTKMSVDRLCLLSDNDTRANITLRIQDYGQNRGQFWDRETKQIPRALNYGLSINCSDTLNPEPDEIFILGSDAEVAVGGLGYLVDLEERLRAQGTPKDQIDAIFNVTTPPNDQQDWYSFEHRLESGYHYLLPPAIANILKDKEGIDIESPEVTTFVEHTPKGARVTVIDDENHEFLMLSETTDGIFILNGDFDDEGNRQKDEYILAVPESDISQSERIFQWAPTKQISTCFGPDGSFFIQTQPTQTLVDRRSGSQGLSKKVGQSTYNNMIIDDISNKLPQPDHQPTLHATVQSPAQLDPICQRNDSLKTQTKYQLIRGFVPQAGEPINTGELAKLALHHSLLAHSLSDRSIKLKDYENIISILEGLTQLHKSVTDSSTRQTDSTPLQYYEVYRKAVDTALNNL